MSVFGIGIGNSCEDFVFTCFCFIIRTKFFAQEEMFLIFLRSQLQYVVDLKTYNPQNKQTIAFILYFDFHVLTGFNGFWTLPVGPIKPLFFLYKRLSILHNTMCTTNYRWVHPLSRGIPTKTLHLGNGYSRLYSFLQNYKITSNWIKN